MPSSATELASVIRSHICLFQSDASDLTRSEAFDSSSGFGSFSSNPKDPGPSGGYTLASLLSPSLSNICHQDRADGDGDRRRLSFWKTLTARSQREAAAPSSESSLSLSKRSPSAAGGAPADTLAASLSRIRATAVRLLCPCVPSAHFTATGLTTEVPATKDV